jgi:hypothetical protein
METRKVQKRRSYRILTFLAAFQPGGAHHQRPQQTHENHGAGDEHFYNKYSKNYGIGGFDVQYNLMLWGEVTHVGGRQEDAGLNQRELPGGVGKGGLASQLTCLQPFGLFCVCRFSVIGQCKVSQQNPEPDPEDEVVDGLPWLGHRGEGLLEVQVLDRGCHRRWQSFHWISWFSICPSVNFGFCFVKSDDFPLCCEILYKYFKNSGFIAATLYFFISFFIYNLTLPFPLLSLYFSIASPLV